MQQTFSIITIWLTLECPGKSGETVPADGKTRKYRFTADTWLTFSSWSLSLWGQGGRVRGLLRSLRRGDVWVKKKKKAVWNRWTILCGQAESQGQPIRLFPDERNCMKRLQVNRILPVCRYFLMTKRYRNMLSASGKKPKTNQAKVRLWKHLNVWDSF